MSQKRLWAPWRVGYISGILKPQSKGCPFCGIPKARSDSKRLILARGRLSFSVLNLFPYTNGHLLVAPYRHVGRFESLTGEEWLELFSLAKDAMRRLKKRMAPHGYNLGINLGRAAGAGIPGHLHLHIVPRWVGDTNFMPVIAESKVISQSLAAAHSLLRKTDGEKRGR
ncbi:MAG: HIT domain-containing protein [Candidatus Omnitrophica bacterium]|nr:HIT domain-containing protein [Candidatus Omnitrophota bacterium]